MAANNMIDNNNAEADGVFVYMGVGGPRAPSDVVCIRVHPSVTIIHAGAFRHKRKLEEVELCEGLFEIGHSAFRECHLLKRIKIPSTVTLIGDSAFRSCHRLEQIELLEGIEEIGQRAFFDCTLLKRIHIPTTVKKYWRACFLLGPFFID